MRVAVEDEGGSLAAVGGDVVQRGVGGLVAEAALDLHGRRRLAGELDPGLGL